jgi:hypothetical protein
MLALANGVLTNVRNAGYADLRSVGFNDRAFLSTVGSNWIEKVM